MNSKTLPDLKALGTSLWVVILSCSTASAAHANQSGKEARQQSGLSAVEWQAFRREMRQHQRQYVGNVHPRSVPAPGEPLNPPPSLDNVIQHNFRANHLPGQVSLFRTARPDSLRRTSYINDAGRNRSIHNGVSLDLSSTDATISIGSNLLGDSTVSIDVGGSTKEIKAGSLVTAAEYAALNQKLSTGSQDLKLNGGGAAIDGSLNLNVVTDDGRAINTSAFVVPESVEVGGDFARHADGIRVQNDLINYGSIYATSSNHKGTAIIGARDVNNFESGLITTDISKSVASSLGVGRSSTNLAVRADRDLSNLGEISSSGDLELSAGRSLNNNGNALARGTFSVNSPTISNDGVMAAAKGDLNITSPVDSNLTINSNGGEFLASKGDINVATTVGANPKTNTTMLGGSWHADNLNITSGDGRIVGSIQDSTAMVNMKAGSTSFGARGGDLLLGTVDCSGDPLIFNTGGSVTIGANQVTGGNPLAIIAAQDVNVGGGVTTLDTSSAAGGGTITIVAGASLTDNPGVSLTIKGGNIAGGNVVLSGITNLTSAGTSGNANGGNINIIAYGAFGIGTVFIPTTIVADGSGTGKGGDITVIGDKNTGFSVDMQGASSFTIGGKGGNILITSAQSGTGPPVVIDATAAPTQGAIIVGNFVTAINSPGKVSVANSVITSGGTVSISSAGSVSTQAVSTSPIAANSSAGSISITSTGGSVDVLSSLVAQGVGTGNGGIINVSSPNGALSVSGAISTIGGTTGTGANITLSAGGGDIFAVNMNASGGSTSGNAGSISVQSTKANATIVLNSTLIDAESTVGAGGAINIAANKGRISFQDNPVIISVGSTSNGDITLVGDGLTTGGIATLTGKSLQLNSGGLNLSGDVVLTTNGTHGLTLPGGNLNIISGRDIILNLGSVGITNGTAAADSGFVGMNAARNIVGGSVQINTVPTAGNFKGGAVSLVAGTTGNLTIGAINSSPSGNNVSPGQIDLVAVSGIMTLNGNLKALDLSQTKGTINLTSSQATTLNLLQIDAASLTVVNKGSITSTKDVTVLSAKMTSTAGSINIGDDFADNFTANSITFDAATNVSQTANLTANNLDISFKGFGTNSLTVIAPSLSGASLKGNVPNGKLDLLIFNTGTLTINSNIQNLKVQANDTGAIKLQSATNVNSLDLTTNNAGVDININGIITANVNGQIQLQVFDSNIVESAGSGLTTSGTGSVNLVLNGTTANATLDKANNINSLNVSGAASTSTVTVDNGANPITITGLSSSQNLKVSTTNSVTGVVIGAGINTSGTLEFDTPRFFNDQNVSADSILIQNLNGNLAVVGGAAPGGILSGSTPSAGSPGNPSSPTAINIVTKSGANLDLFGLMVFNGDVTMNNNFGITTSKPGSQFDGNNNVILQATTWNTAGSQITGKNFLFQGSANGNIVNSAGALNFGSNITVKGHDVAFVALTDINITSKMTVDLSNDLGNGGTLTMLAGYELTPATGGPQQDAKSYTFTATPSAGDINASNLTINVSATGSTGNAGDVSVIANGGSIQLGSITADSTTGINGRITIVGENGITVGDISAVGGGGSQVVNIINATPFISGTPQLDNGTISGGSFTFQSLTGFTAGDIVVNKINAQTINIKSGGISTNTVKLNGGLNFNQLNVDVGSSDLQLNVTNNLVANPFGGGQPGQILLEAGRVIGSNKAAPITLTANGTKQGGQLRLTVRSTDDIVLGTNPGEFQFTATSPGGSGAVVITTEGDITVNSNGVDTTGLLGFGGTHTLVSNAGAININDVSFLNVNGKGANGSGGFLKLQALDIVTTNSAASPLLMTADAVGTGFGGSVIYITSDTTPVFIGTPAKPAKGAADFLSISAKGGATGGGGGNIDVETGGTLFVDPTKVNGAPQAGTSFGAGYKFKAGTTLIVNGPLAADGINGGGGGTIDLESNSKTAFVVNNGGKTPKNGTSSTLSANGAKGDIIVRNFGGGVNIKSALTTANVVIQAGLKGGIVVSKGVLLTGTQSMILQSDTGAIGKKALSISTPVLQTISNGTVKLDDLFGGPIFVGDSSAGKGGFTLTTHNDTDLNDITVVSGNILVTTDGAQLTVDPNANITAQDGAITLNNTDVATGNITIQTSANIATSGKKGGNVIIAIGAVPKKGVNTTPIPANITTDPQGKGLIFFDGVPGGVVAVPGAGTDPLVTGIDKNVIFSNLTTGAGLISLEVNTTITADPPIVEHSHGSMLNQVSPVTSNNADLFPTTLSSNATTDDTMAFASINPPSNGFVNLLACQAVFAMDQSAVVEEPTVRTASDMIIDAAFHGDVETLQSEFSIDKNSSIEMLEQPSGSSKRFTLKNGNVLFAPKTDTTIETPHGTVRIAANTLALIMQTGDKLAVFDVDDQSKDAIVVTTNEKRVCLSPGHSVVVSSHRSDRFEEINPIELVQYRRLNKSVASNGWKVYTSEFSIPSACFAVKPLRHLSVSNDKSTAKMRSHMLKTNAVLMYLRPDQGDYVQYFKPQITAMH